MSRWVNLFRDHAFQKSWNAILELSKSLNVPDETVATNVEELARVRKVVTYINELLIASDPELVPGNIWNSFNDQAAQCLEQMNQFDRNKNIGHLVNANGYLDNLLSYIRPYVVSSESAAQAATAAFKSYSETVNQQIDQLKFKVKDAAVKTLDSLTKAETAVGEIELSKGKIHQLEAVFFKGTETETSLKDRMTALLQDATSWNVQIGDFHRRLMSGGAQEAAIVLQIEQAKAKIDATAKAVSESLENVGGLIKDLDVFYSKIFGTQKEDGTQVDGLEQELETRRKQLDSFKEEQAKTYKTLLEQIETLLPGATSAGLSTAYRELKESFDKPIKHYSKLFYTSLGCIILAGFILITHQIGLEGIEFVDINNPANLFNNMVYKLPIFGSFLWLAVFASKRRSEDRRLQQEYAHKEALAKSYQSFKQQIDALQGGDGLLAAKLLDKAIDAISLNASKTLDGKHGDKFPVIELTEKGIDKIADVVKLRRSA
jgi:hypothetical protein